MKLEKSIKGAGGEVRLLNSALLNEWVDTEEAVIKHSIALDQMERTCQTEIANRMHVGSEGNASGSFYGNGYQIFDHRSELFCQYGEDGLASRTVAVCEP